MAFSMTHTIVQLHFACMFVQVHLKFNESLVMKVKLHLRFCKFIENTYWAIKESKTNNPFTANLLQTLKKELKNNLKYQLPRLQVSRN